MKLRALDPLLHPDENTLHTEFVARFYELITQSIQPGEGYAICERTALNLGGQTSDVSMKRSDEYNLF